VGCFLQVAERYAAQLQKQGVRLHHATLSLLEKGRKHADEAGQAAGRSAAGTAASARREGGGRPRRAAAVGDGEEGWREEEGGEGL
jgi:hypothetical protein